MRVINIIWKFGTGGIAKCFLTYATLGSADRDIDVVSVCIDPQGCTYDRKPLFAVGAEIMSIKSGLDLSWIGKLHKLIKRVSPDVIFCHGFNGPVVVTLVKAIYGLKLPMICSYHGLYYAPTPKKKCLEGVLNGLMLMLYKYVAKRVIVVSDYSKRELEHRHIPTQKLVTVHNGIIDVAPRTCSSADSADRFRIGVVSRLDPFKGVDILIEALQKVQGKTDVSVTLDVVGDGPMEQQLRQKVSELGLDQVVSFTGYQTNIPEWMGKWDMFCLPSFFENHSISILEAMRGGKAIVTTRVGGNEESVTDGKEALIVPARDSDALSDAILRLVEDKELCRNLGKNARRRFLGEFTEEIMKKNLSCALKLNEE